MSELKELLSNRQPSLAEVKYYDYLDTLGANDLPVYHITDLTFMFGNNKQKVCKANSVGDLILLYDAGVRFAVSVVVGNSTDVLCLDHDTCKSFLLLLFGTARIYEFRLTYYRNSENDSDYAFVVAV